MRPIDYTVIRATLAGLALLLFGMTYGGFDSAIKVTPDQCHDMLFIMGMAFIWLSLDLNTRRIGSTIVSVEEVLKASPSRMVMGQMRRGKPTGNMVDLGTIEGGPEELAKRIAEAVASMEEKSKKED